VKAASKVSPEIRQSVSSIPWSEINNSFRLPGDEQIQARCKLPQTIIAQPVNSLASSAPPAGYAPPSHESIVETANIRIF
jgi:hypothetical protein